MGKRDNNKFYKYPETLLSAGGYYSPFTGEPVALTSDQKIIYIVMKSRNSYFTEHYDTQEGISLLCNVHIKTAGRILRGFMKEGVITAVKVGKGAQPNWKYIEVKELSLWKKHGDMIIPVGAPGLRKGDGEEFSPF